MVFNIVVFMEFCFSTFKDISAVEGEESALTQTEGYSHGIPFTGQ